MKRQALNFLNRLLASANLRIDTLTRERQEVRRLDELERKGHFSRPAYGAFDNDSLVGVNELFRTIESQREATAKFLQRGANDVDFDWMNSYFTTPDVEVLYAMIGVHRPRTIVEVGSGNSTRISRQAIIDYGLETRLVAIDPFPRAEISRFADEIHRKPVEELDAAVIASWLRPNDILFIDSSHLIHMGNDVPFLYFELLPKLEAGVLVHIHDICLPFEFPKSWISERKLAFNEHFLLNAILVWSDAFEILWPGYYLERTRPEFSSYFPRYEGRNAQSFWVRKVRTIDR